MLFVTWSLPPLGFVLPIPTFSELFIVIAVASALSSIPWDVNAPLTVNAPSNVPPSDLLTVSATLNISYTVTTIISFTDAPWANTIDVPLVAV